MCHCRVPMYLFLVTLAMALTGIPVATRADEFQLIGARYDVGSSPSRFPKWTSVLERDVRQRAAPSEAPYLSAWLEFLESQRSADEEHQLDAVNRYVNRIPFISDLENYGVYDWWATPAEFFSRNGGDCEDYVITKYLSLKELGRSPDKMRLVVLWDQDRQQYHAVLEYALNGGSVLLGSRHPHLFRWSDVPNFHPIFALNERSYWIFDARHRPQYVARPTDAEHGDLVPVGP